MKCKLSSVTPKPVFALVSSGMHRPTSHLGQKPRGLQFYGEDRKSV
jgi:hypothetical protein